MAIATFGSSSGNSTPVAGVSMSLTGTVRNSMGAAVQGASVRAIFSNGATGTATTSAAGLYTISGTFPAGNCTLLMTPPDYYVQNVGTKDVSVVAGTNSIGRIDPVPTLQVGFLAGGARRADEMPYGLGSIFNIPIDQAGVIYRPAGLTFRTEDGYLTRFDQDEEVLANDPSQPLTPVYRNNVGWTNNGVGRCLIQGGQVATVRIDPDFVTGEDLGNNSASFLGTDKRTLTRMQPWVRCTTGSHSTSFVEFGTTDNQSNNWLGPHGGSGLDNLGGSIREKEFQQRAIRHRIKINLRAQTYFNFAAGPIFPANVVDGYASPATYGGALSYLAPGAWLALRPDFDIAALQTEPGRVLAECMMNYGGHAADDVGGYNAWVVCTEMGPSGNTARGFRRQYGISMKREDDGAHPFSQDIIAVFQNLYVITSITAGNLGGGNGVPRVPKVTATFGNF